MNPADVGAAGTRVLLAVMRSGRPTTDSLAAELDRSKSSVHFQLMRLRKLGLVTWEHGKDGTLRATVGVVADLGKCGSEQTPVRGSGGRLGGVHTSAPATASTAPGRGPDLTRRSEHGR